MADQPKITASEYVPPGSYVYKDVLYPKIVPLENLKKIEDDFEIRDDDIVLVTYPKSGTHFLMAIAEEIKNVKGITNNYKPMSTIGRGKLREELSNLTFAGEKVPAEIGNMGASVGRVGRKSEERPLGPGGPSVASGLIMPLEFSKPPNFLQPMTDVVDNMESPRFYYTHLDASFFKNAISKQKTKFIIVTRNLKDTMVSFYHFYRTNPILGNYTGSFEEFLCLVKTDGLIYKNWFDFTLGYWEHRDKANCHFFTYENLKMSPESEIRRVGEIMGISLSDENVMTVKEKSSFDTMKKTTGNKFLRKGTVGDWKTHFNEEDAAFLDALYEKRMTDLPEKLQLIT